MATFEKEPPMPRAADIPDCPAKPTTTKANERSYEIELITPMFGGGVETRVNDPSFPIRPTSIRGQLQFWWRATVGAQYATRQELRVAQSAVWGDTTRASGVQLRVNVLKIDPPGACARFERDNRDGSRYRSVPTWNEPFYGSTLPYALFPFQGQLAKGGRQIEVPPASCIRKASFRLSVISRGDIDFVKQVEPALWAWVNFGGLGGRTRRGCGAVLCKALAPKDAEALKAMWVRCMPRMFPRREWPTIAECVLHDKEQPGAINAWDRVIERFRHFRQGVKLGRNEGQQPNRPGRSRWPEPETIRRVTKKSLAKHARIPQIPDDAFPRAELGLPIVFHFQEQGDPEDSVLYPSGGHERMASPLILKPLALQNGKFVPFILRLKTPPLEGVDLRQGEQSVPLPNPTLIRGARLASYQNSPMQNRSSTGSALEAFLTYAKSEGFTEVTR
jgi:CRISPR-associated protein Cmr1